MSHPCSQHHGAPPVQLHDPKCRDQSGVQLKLGKQSANTWHHASRARHVSTVNQPLSVSLSECWWWKKDCVTASFDARAAAAAAAKPSHAELSRYKEVEDRPLPRLRQQGRLVKATRIETIFHSRDYRLQSHRPSSGCRITRQTRANSSEADYVPGQRQAPGKQARYQGSGHQVIPDPSSVVAASGGPRGKLSGSPFARCRPV